LQTFIRVESKFLVALTHADDLARIIERHIPLHSYEGGPTAKTFSMYLDSTTLDLYRHRVLDPAHNALLRLRWYSERPVSHVFTELKVLHGPVLTKRRFKLPVRYVSAFLRAPAETAQSTSIGNGHHKSDETTFRSNLQRFISRNGLAPRVQVGYQRQSFQYPEDPKTRVTLDRDVVFCNLNGNRIHRLPFAILEFKFLGHCPEWASAVVDSHSVSECGSFSKYEQGCASIFDLRAAGLPAPRWHRHNRSPQPDLAGHRITPELFQALPRYEYSGEPLAGGEGNRRLAAGEVGGVRASDGCGLDLQALIGHS
jgi:VTC domain